MSQLVDNLIAFRILYKLVEPFDKTDAFKLGIIDKDGKLLRDADSLKTQDEKDAYNYLTRLVFNLKRLLAKLPGGSSKLSSLVASYFLIKESINTKNFDNIEERFLTLHTSLNENVCLVEEQLLVEKFLVLMADDLLSEEGGAAVPTNSVGSGQMADAPKPIGAVKKRNNWKDLPKTFGVTTFEVSDKAYHGYKNAKAKGARWDNHLVPSDEDKDVYDKIKQYSKTYPSKPILIRRKDYEQYTLIK